MKAPKSAATKKTARAASASSVATAGYSGAPLAKKLGIKESFKIHLCNAPEKYRVLLKPLPAAVTFTARVGDAVDLIQVFATDRGDLERRLRGFRGTIRDDAIVWVSWPKKASKVATTITEDTVREIALPLGFVDIKVCAVDETWSGLKLVVRKELRTTAAKRVRSASGETPSR